MKVPSGALMAVTQTWYSFSLTASRSFVVPDDALQPFGEDVVRAAVPYRDGGYVRAIRRRPDAAAFALDKERRYAAMFPRRFDFRDAAAVTAF